MPQTRHPDCDCTCDQSAEWSYWHPASAPEADSIPCCEPCARRVAALGWNVWRRASYEHKLRRLTDAECAALPPRKIPVIEMTLSVEETRES